MWQLVKVSALVVRDHVNYTSNYERDTKNAGIVLFIEVNKYLLRLGVTSLEGT